MKGVSLKELYEWISGWHEAEFLYNGITYMLQPEEDELRSWLVIWDCSENPRCICRHEIPREGEIPRAKIEAVLSEKCFDGKSFYEIEKEVTVVGIC